MKVKSWLNVTYVQDSFNIRVDGEFYNSKRDNDKTIDSVIVQSNGVVRIETK